MVLMPVKSRLVEFLTGLYQCLKNPVFSESHLLPPIATVYNEHTCTPLTDGNSIFFPISVVVPFSNNEWQGYSKLSELGVETRVGSG